MEKTSTKTSALIIAALLSFASPFMFSAINIALPFIQREFTAHAVLLSWVTTSYILSTAIFLVPAGKIADIYGGKKIFMWGVIIFTLFTLLSAFSTSVQMLIVLRIFQGVGGAMVVTSSMAILTSVFPVRERGRAIGINVTAVYIGLSNGPFAGFETSIWFVIAVLIILGLGFALFSSPNVNTIMSSVEKKHFGIASGAVATMMTVGMTVSMAVVTLMFALFIGKAEITPATYPESLKSLKFSMIIFTFLCTAGIFFSSTRGKLRD